MSREKVDFDIVYDEACTMVGFDGSEVGYRPFAYDQQADQDTTCNIFTTRHPYRKAWIETDFAEIERVRKLGRFLIEDSKRRIQANPNFSVKAFKEQGPMFAANLFTSRDWYAAHPDAKFSVAHGRQPDAANPEHIGNWPEGGYVNCLGVSIGMVALAELGGYEYLYASELRGSDTDFLANFTGIANKIQKAYPEVYSLDGLAFKAIQVHDLTQTREHRKLYAGMPINNPSVFEELGEKTLRDYHHFLLMSLGEDGPRVTAQIDPYSIVYKQHDLTPDDFARLRESLTPDATAIVTDETVQKTYSALNDCLDDMLAYAQRYKALQWTKTTIAELEQCATRHIQVIFNNHYDAAQATRIAKNTTLDIIIGQHIVLAEKLGMSDAKNRLLRATEAIDMSATYDALDEISAAYEKADRYDSELRKFNSNLCGVIPLAIFMQIYRLTLSEWLDVRRSGQPNKSSEIGETDFMIGAMFLNHYANNRKDGKINVARYLARYSTSQLIWLAAACDGESEEDPSMQAIGEQVKLLPPAKMHPRVHLVVKS